MAPGLRSVTERTGDGAGNPILDGENGEELMLVQPEVAIVLGDRAPESPGTLYISSKQLVWLSDVDRQKGYAVDFLSVSLHAISRDPEAYPLSCIYAQVETGRLSSEDEESGGSDSERDDNLELSHITEIRFVPSDPSQLEILFSVFCQCAELNPEPDGDVTPISDDISEEGEDSQWHFSEDFDNPIGYSNGLEDHDLAHGVLELQIDDQRFEDAEETECDSHVGQQ